MKKLALAIAVAAISGQAAAAQVYSNDSTAVDVYGQLRTILKKTNNNGEKSFSLASSRVGFIGTHKMSDDLTVEGKMQIKYGDSAENFYSDVLYIGMNSKTFGGVRVGNMGSIWDDEMGIQDNTYAYGGSSSLGGDQYGTGVQSNTLDYRFPIDTSVGVITLRAQTQLAPTSVDAKRNDLTAAGFTDNKKDTEAVTIDKAVSAGVVWNSNFGLDVAAVYAATDVDLQADADATPAKEKTALGTAKSYGISTGYTVGKLLVGAQLTRVKVKKDDKSANFDLEKTGYGLGAKYSFDNNVSPYATYDIVKTDNKAVKTTDATKARTLAAGVEFKPNASIRTFVEASRNINDGEKHTTEWAIGARYYF
ncbi:porin [Sansalvadorimonas verongulae]|uniref:porin n=1 Tax=Sansalvadorimonas verongulae TaxID=2172824 RepID=UPI0012BBF48B|nr:porin [Sansalvadorimonas verongulae]MTI12469.1 porin [Sansalvadorimonas verongulae]